MTSIPYDFAAAGSAVIRYLHARLGFDLWMIVRTEGEDCIVLQAEDHGYGISTNAVFNWEDSLCSRMTAGKGPRVAARASAVPTYDAAPIRQKLKIGAYMGVPLTADDGSLFGTLCGIHPTPMPDSIELELPLVELLAAMLSSVLSAELRAVETKRHVERVRSEAETDALTKLYNRRGWDRLVDAEEHRCRRYGQPACVIAIDLDGLKSVNDSAGHAAGDELLRRAASAIRTTVRETDVVARVGGDEFVVLGVECDESDADSLLRRIRSGLDAVGVDASLGMALRLPALGLEHAHQDADRAMYVDKARRKTVEHEFVETQLPSGIRTLHM
jgi:diguanylate cyclase (GGDEF)-like protein